MSTTVLICCEAVFHVPSIAPATSPAAWTGTQNIKHINTAAIIILFLFLSHIFFLPLMLILRCDMPVTPKLSSNLDAVCQIHTQHSRWCPAIYQPYIGCITSIRVPNRCEMGFPVIGAVLIFFKFMCHMIATAHAADIFPNPSHMLSVG